MPVGSPQGQLDVFPGDDLVGTGHCLYSLRLPYWSYDSEFFLYVYGSQRCSAAGSALLRHVASGIGRPTLDTLFHRSEPCPGNGFRTFEDPAL